MLDRNFELRHSGRGRVFSGGKLYEALGLIAFVLSLTAFLPVTAAAQTGSQSSLAPTQGAAYGAGGQTPLQFEGEQGAENEIILSGGATGFYDDNVQSSNDQRVGDEALSLNANLGIRKQTSHLILSFNYQPSFLIYRQTSGYDRLNHSANGSLAYRLSPRIILGLHDVFSYENGVLPSLGAQSIAAGPPPPTGLNQGIYPYTTRTLANMGGADLTFVKSRRNSITFSADYNRLKFGDQTGQMTSLYNAQGVSAGLQYQHRISEHTTFGILGLHQDTTYTGGLAFGDTQRSQIESGYVSVGSRLTPTLNITVFGGPQYVHTVGNPSGVNSITGNFQEAGGVSITKQARATAIQVSFQRSVSDGGGLYTSVVNTFIAVGARRHLFGRWDGGFDSTLNRANTSLFQQSNGLTDSIFAGVSISRPIREGDTLRFSYDTMHQITSGSLPFAASFDRNVLSVNFDFRIKTIPLGQ